MSATLEGVKRILEKDKAREAYEDFGLSLSDDFEGIPEKNMLVLEGLAGNKKAGMTAAFIPDGGSFCRMDILYLRDEQRTSANIRYLLDALIHEAKEAAGLSSIIWRYQTTKPVESDPYIRICSGVDGIKVNTEDVCRLFEIDLKKMVVSHRQFGDYNEGFLEGKGLLLEKLAGCGDKRTEQIEAMLIGADDEMRELQPLDGSVQDEENSMLLIDKASDEIAGWMMCRAEGACVEIARFYVLPDKRRASAGLYFGAYMLARLAGKYEKARMKVRTGNRPVFSFLRNVFAESVSEGTDRLLTMSMEM